MRRKNRYGNDVVAHTKFPKPSQVREVDQVIAHGSVRSLASLVEGISKLEPSQLQDVMRQCCKIGRDDLVRYLISKGLDVNAREAASGRTLLHLAACANSISTVCALLENGADKSLRCNQGLLAHEFAASIGHTRVAHLISCFTSPWDLILERQNENDNASNQTSGYQSKTESLEMVLSQKEAAFGADHPGLVLTLERLAIAYAQEGGHHDQAKTKIHRASKLCQLLQSQNDPMAWEWSARVFQTAGDLHVACHEWRDAQLFFEKALEALTPDKTTNDTPISKKQQCDPSKWSFPPALLEQRRLLIKLAQAFEAQGEYTESAKTLERVVNLVSNETGDTDHPVLVAPLLSLGRVQGRQGLWNAAHEALALALAIADKHLGPLHADIAICLDHLAFLYLETARYPESEALFRRALSIREQVCHPVHDRETLLHSENNVNLCVIARASALRKRKRKPPRHLQQ